MSPILRLSALARAAIVATALLAPALAGCARPVDDSMYYLGENDRVPTAICVAWAAC